MVLVTHPKPKVTPHARKRHAGHHRRTKHYSQTYWPYLTMLAVLVCSFIFNSLWAPGRQVLGYTSDLTATSLLQRTNIARLDNSNQPLTMNTKLNAAAHHKANDMAARGYWSHTTPEGRQPWSFVQDQGYSYSVVGENLAYGFDDSSAAINAWLNSPNHRSNVLSDSFREVGFGLAASPNFQNKGQATIIVAIYAAPQGSPVQAGSFSPSSGSVLSSRTVSRIETISTTNAALIAVLAASAAAAGAMYVTLKHGRLLRRALVKGELFVVRHHILDLLILGIGGVGFVITRSAGVIH